jgi:glycerate kinase
MVEAEANGPRGKKVRASFGVLGDTGVVEVASAVGLALLAIDERDPTITTSYGAGQLVLRALDRGCRRIVIGLGGSATVDGAAGLVEALGGRFLDSYGNPIARGGAGLAALERIDLSGLDRRLAKTELVAVCDVDNPLLGDRGASRIFGPQKGASPAVVERLEANLAHLADVIARDLGRDVRSIPHGGAAGGMGAGIAGMLGGKLVEGADEVLDLLHFEERLAGCDLVLTAEGHLDRQTLGHKGPWAVANRARRAGVPVIVLAGGVGDEVDSKEFATFDAVVSICARPMPLEQAMAQARVRMIATAEQVGRLLDLGARTQTRTQA